MITTAILPFSDRLEVINILRKDGYLKSLGFTAEKIYNTAYTTEMIEKNSYQIFVYNASSTAGNTGIYISPVIQIDISVPQSKSSTAGKAAEQIIALLQGYEIGNHTAMELVAPSPLNLPCPFGFECIGLRFSYNATVFNEVKMVDLSKR